MEYVCILCSSITYAMKGKDILKKKGYKVTTKKPQKNGCRCGHCIMVPYSQADEVREILVSQGIKLREEEK